VLLREVPPGYKTQVNDVLLTALVEAFARWTGSSSWVVDLEGHGREELFDDVDLSRTVGWFTTLFPVRFELGMPDDQSAALKSVKEQLRAVPNRGMGYGLLRYLSRSSEQIERLRSQPRAEVTFNYLGQVDRVLPEGSRFQWARESSGPTQSQSASRSHLLDVRGLISAGSLQVSFQYSENVFRGETIEQLARSFLAALRSLISHCQSSEAGGYTSSDFELANLTQSEIDRHFGNDRTLEDVYALSPLQKGMLFHCLHAPNSGAYLSHLVLRLDGALDVQAFKRTWDRLIARHTVFRTGFLWDQVSEPVQVVRRNTEIVWSEEDWCGADAETQRADLRSFLKRDRIRGFDLSNAPLIRLALIRMAERAHYFVWTHHHLVIDGWSVPLVLQEAFELYKAFLSGAEAPLPPARPFRDYIAWLGKQDFVKAESYWRRTLAGLEEPTSLGVSRTADDGAGEVGNAEYQSRLSPASTRSLRAFARQHDLTVNTVVQGAWALLLGAYSGEEHVVYGAALSGRPPSLVDVTRIPGMFINTLPIRAFIDAEMSVREWLGRLQEQQVEMREYEYSALTEVQSWSQVPRSVPLFDVIVAFQNFPVDKTLIEEAALHGLGIELVLSQEQSMSPLTLFVALEEELSVRLVYDRKRFDEGTIAGIANRYLRVLESIVSNGDAALMDLRIDTNVTVPQLQAMAIRPPSAEELLLLGSGADDMEKVTFERED
jgi:non-ribosomal peptide synthase protein (TIGR01720 family)